MWNVDYGTFLSVHEYLTLSPKLEETYVTHKTTKNQCPFRNSHGQAIIEANTTLRHRPTRSKMWTLIEVLDVTCNIFINWDMTKGLAGGPHAGG